MAPFGTILTTESVDKILVGLNNVDNTNDLAKPVSTAQQTALDLKADLALMLELLADNYV